MKKLIIGIVAENNAGKSSMANALESIGAKHYSMRQVIQERYAELNNGIFCKTRAALNEFSQQWKKRHGAQVFIEEAIQHFCASGCTAPYAVVESLRAPGEAQWLLQLPKKIPSIDTLIVGITAPYEDRLSRFLQGGMGEIGGELSENHFIHHESLAQGGSTEWEENVAETLKLAHKVFNNPNGPIDIFKKNIIEYTKNVYQQNNKTFTKM